VTSLLSLWSISQVSIPVFEFYSRRVAGLSQIRVQAELDKALRRLADAMRRNAVDLNRNRDDVWAVVDINRLCPESPRVRGFGQTVKKGNFDVIGTGFCPVRSLGYLYQ